MPAEPAWRGGVTGRRTWGTRLARAVVALLLAATALTVLRRISAPPVPPAEVERPHLVLWALPGCYELRVDPWETDPGVPPGGEAAPASESPSFLTPPSRVALVPDSIDPWRRSETTYRAVPLAGDHDDRLRDRMRWFTRADTLWLIWSDRRAQAGIALHESGEGFEGVARAHGPEESFDGRARALAWKINCSTLGREPRRRAPRR